jgi:hypothetical protein
MPMDAFETMLDSASRPNVAQAEHFPAGNTKEAFA